MEQVVGVAPVGAGVVPEGLPAPLAVVVAAGAGHELGKSGADCSSQPNGVEQPLTVTFTLGQSGSVTLAVQGTEPVLAQPSSACETKTPVTGDGETCEEIPQEKQTTAIMIRIRYRRRRGL
jgi:hypothetical protein